VPTFLQLPPAPPQQGKSEAQEWNASCVLPGHGMGRVAWEDLAEHITLGHMVPKRAALQLGVAFLK